MHRLPQGVWYLCLCLVLSAAALPAVAQPAALPAPADSLLTVAVDSLAVLTGQELPRPAALEPAPVDLWDTGLSPTRAVIMTPAFPGWGQLYADNSWQAALGFGAEMYFWTNMLTRDRQAVRATDFAETFEPDDPNPGPLQRDRRRELGADARLRLVVRRRAADHRPGRLRGRPPVQFRRGPGAGSRPLGRHLRPGRRCVPGSASRTDRWWFSSGERSSEPYLWGRSSARLTRCFIR